MVEICYSLKLMPEAEFPDRMVGKPMGQLTLIIGLPPTLVSRKPLLNVTTAVSPPLASACWSGPLASLMSLQAETKDRFQIDKITAAELRAAPAHVIS